MNITLTELQQWMRAPEGEHLEFKEAKQNFHFEKLVKYCAALANEGGGRIVLGITDKRPRRVVGSAAFADLARTKAGLIERLHLRIEGEELAHPDGRVLVFTVPSRPLFAESVRQGKRLPDFTHTDQFQVSLTLHGQIQDPDFLRFLEKVGPDRVETFAVEDLLVLDRVHREQRVPDELRDRLRPLIAEGIIERVGRGRGVRHMLSRKFYEMKGLPGSYTRERGLDREQNKTLLLNHVRASGGRGCPLAELEQVLPALAQRQIKYLLQVLRDEGFVRYEGRGAGARWIAEEP